MAKKIKHHYSCRNEILSKEPRDQSIRDFARLVLSTDGEAKDFNNELLVAPLDIPGFEDATEEELAVFSDTEVMPDVCEYIRNHYIHDCNICHVCSMSPTYSNENCGTERQVIGYLLTLPIKTLDKYISADVQNRSERFTAYVNLNEGKAGTAAKSFYVPLYKLMYLVIAEAAKSLTLSKNSSLSEASQENLIEVWNSVNPSFAINVYTMEEYCNLRTIWINELEYMIGRNGKAKPDLKLLDGFFEVSDSSEVKESAPEGGANKLEAQKESRRSIFSAITSKLKKDTENESQTESHESIASPSENEPDNLVSEDSKTIIHQDECDDIPVITRTPIITAKETNSKHKVVTYEDLLELGFTDSDTDNVSADSDDEANSENIESSIHTATEEKNLEKATDSTVSTPNSEYSEDFIIIEKPAGAESIDDTEPVTTKDKSDESSGEVQQDCDAGIIVVNDFEVESNGDAEKEFKSDQSDNFTENNGVAGENNEEGLPPQTEADGSSENSSDEDADFSFDFEFSFDEEDSSEEPAPSEVIPEPEEDPIVEDAAKSQTVPESPDATDEEQIRSPEEDNQTTSDEPLLPPDFDLFAFPIMTLAEATKYALPRDAGKREQFASLLIKACVQNVTVSIEAAAVPETATLGLLIWPDILKGPVYVSTDDSDGLKLINGIIKDAGCKKVTYNALPLYYLLQQQGMTFRNIVSCSDYHTGVAGPENAIKRIQEYHDKAKDIIEQYSDKDLHYLDRAFARYLYSRDGSYVTPTISYVNRLGFVTGEYTADDQHMYINVNVKNVSEEEWSKSLNMLMLALEKHSSFDKHSARLCYLDYNRLLAVFEVDSKDARSFSSVVGRQFLRILEINCIDIPTCELTKNSHFLRSSR